MDSETTQSAGMVKFLAWFEVNKQRLAIGAFALLAAIFLTVIIVQRQTGKELDASEALSDVRLPFVSSAPQPGTVENLTKVAETHKGSKAAARALLVSAGLMFSQGQYAPAQERFNQVIREYGDSPWLAQANLGVAASLAAQGKTNEAIAKYEELQKRFASAPIANDVKLGLARLYENTKPEDAYHLYDDLLKSGSPQSIITMEAQVFMEALMEKRPELEKLRQPPAPVVPTPAPSVSSTQQIRLTPSTNAAGGTNATQIKLMPSSSTPTPGAPNVPAATPPAAAPPTSK